MSNHSEEYADSGSSTTNARPTWTGDSENVGADAPATQISGPAGGITSPQQGHPRPSDDLLLQAIRTLLARNSRPFAAGVYGLMRQIEPTFTFDSVGFPSFRAYLSDAANRGVVTFSPAPRGSDVVVAEASGSGASQRPALITATTLRKDLWDAFVDWSNESNYVFRPMTNEVVALMPGQSGGDGAVRIPSASRDDQLVWMRELADSETSAPVKDELDAALREDQPTRAFARVLRERTSVGRAWKRHLRRRILSRASQWAEENGLPESVLQPAKVQEPSSRREATTNEDQAARDRILAILADLPLSELLKLRIPLEYALRG